MRYKNQLRTKKCVLLFSAVGNATPAILVVFLMFVVPANPQVWPFKNSKKLSMLTDVLSQCIIVSLSISFIRLGYSFTGIRRVKIGLNVE